MIFITKEGDDTSCHHFCLEDEPKKRLETSIDKWNLPQHLHYKMLALLFLLPIDTKNVRALIIDS